MLVSSLTPNPDDRVHFERSDIRNVPENPGCYVLTAFNESILYIGQSDDLARRMKEHLNDASKRIQTDSGVVFWFYYKLCSFSHLDGTERGWVNEYKIKNGVLPILNKIHPPT